MTKNTKRSVIMFTSQTLGSDSKELGSILMRNFLCTLGEAKTPPESIILMHAGVKLAVQGSETEKELLALKNRGVKLLICGTCVDYYGLKDEINSEEISNMHDITALLLAAEKLISV